MQVSRRPNNEIKSSNSYSFHTAKNEKLVKLNEYSNNFVSVKDKYFADAISDARLGIEMDPLLRFSTI